MFQGHSVNVVTLLIAREGGMSGNKKTLDAADGI